MPRQPYGRAGVAAALALSLAACASLGAHAPGSDGSTRVGPRRGTVIVVGGGSMGQEIYDAFIQAAGGPDALIVDVPTAGGAATYTQNAPGTRGWREAGAKNIIVLHTTDRRLADSDSFAAVIARAGGVWFEGGRQFHLVDSYAGTKTEKAFHDLLARGGVVGGSSAGASILGDFLVRGAPSNNNMIMDDPSHEKGFAFLRGVGIDQHVVARERLPDLADSIMPKYPKLLGISEDEGTAWVVRGDTAVIIGRNKAFVYGAPQKDPRKPFLTLHPGDRYDLGARRVLHRASDDSPVSQSFVDGLLSRYDDPQLGGATVLVARDGEVFVDKSYGIADQPRYMPTTTLPQFPLGDMSAVFTSLCDQLPPAPSPAQGAAGPAQTARDAAPQTAFQRCLARRVSTPIGMHRTMAAADGQISSDVDELYRLALGLEANAFAVRDSASGAKPSVDQSRGWHEDTRGGAAVYASYVKPEGRRGAMLRVPSRRATVIVLTNDDAADARGVAARIMDRLLGS